MRNVLFAISALVAWGCADTSEFVSNDGGGQKDARQSVDSSAPKDSAPVVDQYTGDLVSNACQEVIDLVFVLDLSSSMLAVLDELKQDIDRVVNASNALKQNSHFGLVTFVDNVKVDDSGPKEGGKVHIAGSTLQSAFDRYIRTYTNHNRNPGDGPNGPTTQNPICEENSLDALYEAADKFPWRNGSTRVVILATDDTFLERVDNYGDRDGDGKTDKTDFPREGDYPATRTMDETVALLKQKKIRVFSFTRLLPPGPLDPLRCGTGRRLPWSAVAGGWSIPYKGKKPIPEDTGGKNFDLVQVLNAQLALTETINNVVLESRCNPIK
jgi:hypothetical protein